MKASDDHGAEAVGQVTAGVHWAPDLSEAAQVLVDELWPVGVTSPIPRTALFVDCSRRVSEGRLAPKQRAECAWRRCGWSAV